MPVLKTSSNPLVFVQSFWPDPKYGWIQFSTFLGWLSTAGWAMLDRVTRKSTLVTPVVHVHKFQGNPQHGPEILPPFSDLITLFCKAVSNSFHLTTLWYTIPLLQQMTLFSPFRRKKWSSDGNSFFFLFPKIKLTNISLSVIYRSVLTVESVPLPMLSMKVPSPLVFSMTFINYLLASHI